MHPLMRLAFGLTALLLISSSSAWATFWSFSLPSSSTGSFEAEEADSGVTIAGTYQRLANSFIRFTVTARTGATAPAVGAVKYAFEVPGFALFSQPLLTTETQLISSVITGECPTHAITGLLTFALWASGSTNNVSSASQPAFGRYTWNPSTNSMTITNLYNLTSYSTSTGFSSFSLSGSCRNGEVTFSGPGDRGGVMYITAEKGAFFRTNMGKAVFALPQNHIPNVGKLDGSYAVFNYDNASTQTIHPVRITINSGAGSGTSLADIDNGTPATGDTWSIANISVNTPVSGVFTGDLQRAGSTPTKLACSTFFRNRTVIFCAAQSTTDPSRPMNFAMVSDGAAFPSGTLDTYALSGGTGYGSSDFGGADDSAVGAALLSDGRIVLAGNVDIGSTSTVGLARFLPDGSVDSAFGTSGSATFDFAPTSVNRTAEGLALATDGSIFVTGYAAESNPLDLFVLKTDANGALDSRFDGDGIRFASLARSTSGRAIALTSEQKIFAAGNYNNGLNTDFFLARFRSDGSYDTAFNATGWVSSGVGGTGVGEQVTTLAIDSLDRPLLAGTADTKLAIARFTTNGVLDREFNASGKIIASFSGVDRTVLNSLILQPDGKIVVAGYSIKNNRNLEILRYTAAGAADTSFGSTGRTSVTFPKGSGANSNWNEEINALAVQFDGKLVGIGTAWNGTDTDSMIVRFTSTGQLDTSFNTRGYLLIDQGDTEAAYSGAIQADAKYLFAGSRQSRSQLDFNFGRVWP